MHQAHRRPLPFVLFLLALFVGSSRPANAADAPLPSDTNRPDILLVICDDMDPTHFGFRSNTAVTPTLDALRAEGTLFENAWMSPKCAPSLASLLTGQSPHQHGRFYNRHASGQDLPLDHSETFVSYLAQNGYRNYLGGKWWFDDPLASGFDAAFTDQGQFVRQGQSHLLEWLDDLNPGDNFFLWWAPLLPHTPHNPRQRHLDRIDRQSIEVPEYIAPTDRSAFIEKEHQLLAMTNWLDEGLEELMLHLEALGRTNDLLVITIIDNGWANGRVSKGSPFEKGLQSPIILTYPGRIPAGETRHQLASMVDIYPTILDYVGIRGSGAATGFSLRPVIENRERFWRSQLIEVVYPGVGFSYDWWREAYALTVRTDRWKGIGYLKNIHPSSNQVLRIHHVLTTFPIRSKRDFELYDLTLDPQEQEDLVFRPEFEAQRVQYAQILRSWWIDNARNR